MKPLPAPAVYIPFDSGAYKVAPSLIPLEKPLGNGPADKRVFQLDREFEANLKNTHEARADDLAKYYGVAELSPSVQAAVFSYMIRQLHTEHPRLFTVEDVTGGLRMRCALTGESLLFDPSFNLLPESDGDYTSSLDALASQVQEDLAIVRVENGRDWLAALHVTAPNYWDPSEKLGKSFVDIHAPVAGIESLNRSAPTLIAAMIKNARYQRFAWGLTTDRRLNHHPNPPAAFDGTPSEWHGRTFNPKDPELYVRIERQVIIGFEDVSAFLFSIRPYFLDCATMHPKHRSALHSALNSMTSVSRIYKGLERSVNQIMQWLDRK